MQNSITERAMLVSLKISLWTPTKQDKEISAEVARRANADADMGRYNKKLLAKDALAKVMTAAGKARTEHYARTLPWSDEGFRILSQVGYFGYCAKMRELEQNFETAVTEFMPRYQSEIDRARVLLNGNFKETDYPSPSEVRARFRVGFNVVAMPLANDFRVDLGDVEVARIQRIAEERHNRMLEDGFKEAMGKAIEVIKHMATSLREYSVTSDGVENAFRDTLVSNVAKMAEILPTLNVVDNPIVSQIADEMKTQLVRFSGQELRDSSWKRDEVAASAEAIQRQMEQFI